MREKAEENAKTTEDDVAWVKNTRIFHLWNEIKQEISLHKWYESEKAGHDIGWDRAETDWRIHHGRDYYKRKRAHSDEE
jgi:hypothetical protein